jgi:integrase
MATITITTRTTKSGEKRRIVRYRLGGRAYPLEHAGSFKTWREARLRRDLVAGEIAAGRNPAELLAALRDPRPKRTIAAVHADWLASRLDVSPGTKANFDAHWKRLESRFATIAPDDVDHTHVQAWVSEQANELEPPTLRAYLGTLRQLLDFAGVNPNPVRDRRVKLPRAEREVPTPPSARHLLALLERLPAERRLLFAVLEQTGARLGESLGWTWGDLDLDAGRILSRPEVVKGRRGNRKPRWIQLPDWQLELLVESVAPDDRAPNAPLFAWPRTAARPGPGVARVMRRACQAAGIPHFHPHDLRHRRISLWHAQGIPAREIGERVGQRQISTTLDVYTHVITGDEIPATRYCELVRG